MITCVIWAVTSNAVWVSMTSEGCSVCHAKRARQPGWKNAMMRAGADTALPENGDAHINPNATGKPFFLPACFWVDWRDCSMCGRTTVCLTGWGQHLGGIKGHSSPLYFFSYLFPLQTWTFPSSEIPHVQGQKRQLNPTARPCACAGHHTALTDPSSLSASRFNYKPVNQCEK